MKFEESVDPRHIGLLVCWGDTLNSSHIAWGLTLWLKTRKANCEPNIVIGLGLVHLVYCFREYTSTFINQNPVLGSVFSRNNYKLWLKTTDTILLMLNEHCSLFFSWADKEAPLRTLTGELTMVTAGRLSKSLNHHNFTQLSCGWRKILSFLF